MALLLRAVVWGIYVFEALFFVEFGLMSLGFVAEKRC